MNKIQNAASILGKRGGESGVGKSKARSPEHYKKLHDMWFDSFPQRFWSRVKKTDGCWNWTGEINSKGYGIYERCKERKVAHRWAWILTFGSIDENLCLLHKCDNPKCCNPDHLIPGTNKQNSEDMVKKGRQRKGKIHHMAKLNENTVVEIRNLISKGTQSTVIANQYGISETSVRDIKMGRTWRHLHA